MLTSQVTKCTSVMWLNKAKYVKRVKKFYRVESRVYPLFKLSVYAFYRSFLCKRKISSLQNLWMELENQLDACRVANSSKINVDSSILMSKCWDTLSCLNSSQCGVGVGRTQDRKSHASLISLGSLSVTGGYQTMNGNQTKRLNVKLFLKYSIQVPG